MTASSGEAAKRRSDLGVNDKMGEMRRVAANQLDRKGKDRFARLRLVELDKAGWAGWRQAMCDASSQVTLWLIVVVRRAKSRTCCGYLIWSSNAWASADGLFVRMCVMMF